LKHFTDSVPGKRGVYRFGSKYEPRAITFRLVSPYLTSETKPQARLYARGRLPKGQIELTIDGITYYGKVNWEIEDLPHHLIVNVTMKCLDPFGYSEIKTLTGSGIAKNEGNHETYPTFTIPTSTNPTIQVGTTVLSYTGVVPSGKTLVIDCKHKTAYIGSDNVIANVSGTFPILLPGENTVTVPSGTITSWRDCYV